jgi:predicted nucleic-acid-binding protein
MERKNKASVDTNLLLRLVLNDVPDQMKQVKKLLIKKTQYEVSDLAITEMAFVLERLYKMERRMVVDFLLVVIRHPRFNCNKNLIERILPLYISEQKLSFNDCALLGYARLNNATPLYSFDKKLVEKSDGDAEIPE